MGQRISAPGVGLIPPQFLYPSEINPAQVPVDLGNAYQTLFPGQALAVPEGSFYVGKGSYSVVQYNDPVIGAWRGLSSARTAIDYVISDGFNYRIANLTGCVVAAVVTSGGSGFTSTPTVTSSAGGSTFQAIVGGALSVSTVSNAGSGYGIPPLLCIAAPPSPGVQATGYCVLTGTSVTSVVLTNVGAGYPSAPTAQIVPSPYDPNLTNNTALVNASVTLAVVSSGSITACICTYNGTSVSSVPTLSISGGSGSGATISAVQLTTLVSATVSSSGTWTGGAALTSVGGTSGSTPWNTNPQISEQGFISRPIQAYLSGASSSLTSISTLYDSGLFLTTPNLVVSPITSVASSLATVTVTATYGGVTDIVLLQPSP